MVSLATVRDALMLLETLVLKVEGRNKERKDKDRGSSATWARGRTGRQYRFLERRRPTQEDQHSLFFVTPSVTTELCDRRFCTRESNGFQFLSGVVNIGMWATDYSIGHGKSLNSILNVIALLAGLPQQFLPSTSGGTSHSLDSQVPTGMTDVRSSDWPTMCP